MPAASVIRSAPSARLRAARAACAIVPPLAAQRLRDAIYPQDVAARDALAYTRRAVTGSPFTGTTADHVSYPFAVHGYFNWRNVAIAGAVCGAGDVIYDVGANTGSETVSYSDVVGRDGAVYAFEPFPSNVERLRANAARTIVRNVDVRAVAVGERRGSITFVAPTAGNSGLGYVADGELDALGEAGGAAAAAGARAPARDAIEVECLTLDELRTEIRAPRLLVIDAEGHEAAILRGAGEMLTHDRPIVVLEAIEHLLARAGASTRELAERLTAAHYRLMEIRRLTVAPIGLAPGQLPPASDWLAVPSGEEALVERIRRRLQLSGLLPPVRGLNPMCRRATRA